VVDVGSWSLLHSRPQVRFPLVPISVGKSIQSFALALNGAPASGRWDWFPRISRLFGPDTELKKKKRYRDWGWEVCYIEKRFCASHNMWNWGTSWYYWSETILLLPQQVLLHIRILHLLHTSTYLAKVSLHRDIFQSWPLTSQTIKIDYFDFGHSSKDICQQA